ncbi:LCP family protein [Nocardia sp. alder85J]|uniref:LCP family protein n=1 Tax=Nocardia sp. alder85J TaxID=2862949 RepID=UPI001CD7BE31|nr:LCP family protein [Nocardia sp. alder85J]MCX4097543.1 LCP family protein [Nocardia sp. alder85J]
MARVGEYPRRQTDPVDPATVPIRPYTSPRRPRRPPRRRTSRALIAGRSVIALAAVLVLVGTGTAWRTYHTALAGVTTSSALDDGPKSVGADQNILIMGLDSRLDEHGNPLPQDMYDALHAGDDSEGGYNSNVLILMHIPGDGSKSTAISIPRDDYVTLDPAACGGSTCKGKVKQAYGLAYQATKDKLTSTVKDPVELEQRSRDVGRKSEIATVRAFLGGVPVDHFVEVTLVAFFQIAQAVQPITVCLNENTSDRFFSGADFHKGEQQIDAEQAMAFVRQRRDPDPDLNFTDMDRTRRQQAFIVSLARQLQDSGTLTNIGKLRSLLDIAKQNIAIDSGLDPMQFAQRASTMMSGGMTLFTLPVVDFGQDDLGEDVNIVDVPAIRATVHDLLFPPGAASSTPTSTATVTVPIPAATGVTLNVVNGSDQNGLARKLEVALVNRGFTAGDAVSGGSRNTTAITYGTGADSAAAALADQLGVTATKSSAVDSHTVVVTIGADVTSNATITTMVASVPDDATTSATPTSTTPPPPPVSATATGNNSPAPTDLSSMDSGKVPCVK